MKKLIFLALLALITFGCRTVKQTSTNKAEVKTSANLDIKQSVYNKSKIDRSQVTVDNSVTNSVVNEVTTITQLSKPDSTGKQYPVQTTVINRITENNKAANIKTAVNVNKTNDNKTTIKDKSVYKSDSTSSQINKLTEKTKIPAWVYVAVLVLISGLLLGLYTILKRNGIIK